MSRTVSGSEPVRPGARCGGIRPGQCWISVAGRTSSRARSEWINGGFQVWISSRTSSADCPFETTASLGSTRSTQSSTCDVVPHLTCDRYQRPGELNRPRGETCPEWVWPTATRERRTETDGEQEWRAEVPVDEICRSMP